MKLVSFTFSSYTRLDKEVYLLMLIQKLVNLLSNSWCASNASKFPPNKKLIPSMNLPLKQLVRLNRILERLGRTGSEYGYV
jgi:hypothetical protein